MRLWRWFTGLFRREPPIPDELPEVLGYVTDEQGRRQPLHRGWIKHESLSPDQIRRVARLRDVLVEAYPMTLDGWVDGFLRDADPENEIQIVEACAAVYQQVAAQAQLGTEEKKPLYGVLCALSAGATGPQLAAALPSGRSMPTLDELAGLYLEARQEGRRP